MTDMAQLWVYLSATPLVWLFATLAAYAVADRVAKAMVHAVELCGGGDKDPF